MPRVQASHGQLKVLALPLLGYCGLIPSLECWPGAWSCGIRVRTLCFVGRLKWASFSGVRVLVASIRGPVDGRSTGGRLRPIRLTERTATPDRTAKRIALLVVERLFDTANPDG